MTPKQAANFYWHTLRNVRRRGKKLLTSVKPDPVTKKRTAAVTVESQTRYMNLVAATRKRLALLSPGTGKNSSGKTYTYKDVEEHFVGNLDEECSIACADGAVSIVGAAGKVRR
jgi:hypothetical protein